MSHDSAFTTGLHLRGDVAPDVCWYPDGIQSQPKPYASVSFDGLTVFVNEPGQAQPLADAFADVAAHFGAEPVRAYVMRQARETIAEFRAWLAEPVTGTGEDGPPRQYRYAEFAGRMATLLDELTDSPEAVADPATDTRCTTCHRSAHWGPDAPGLHGHAYTGPARRAVPDGTVTTGPAKP